MHKQAYQQKLEAQLNEWDAKLDLFKAKVKNAAADVRLEYENQLDDLQGKRRELTRYLNDIKQRGESAWEDLKVGAEQSWREFGNALDDAAKRFN